MVIRLLFYYLFVHYRISEFLFSDKMFEMKYINYFVGNYYNYWCKKIQHFLNKKVHTNPTNIRCTFLNPSVHVHTSCHKFSSQHFEKYSHNLHLCDSITFLVYIIHFIIHSLKCVSYSCHFFNCINKPIVIFQNFLN